MSTPAIQYPPVIPAIAVQDAARAIEFYKTAFGAVELYRLTDPESGKVGHAELNLNGGMLMISDEYPAFHKTPQTLGGTSARFVIMVDNVDAMTERAKAAGATVIRPPTTEFYGCRGASLRDPFGHEWMLQQVVEQVSPDEMQRRWNSMCAKK